MIHRLIAFLYGIFCYLVFFISLFYAVRFLGGFGVPTPMDSVSPESWKSALLIDLTLLLLFALQHSFMAGPGFQIALVHIVPVAVERSTYVLASSVSLLFLFWQWRPLGGTVWNLQNAAARTSLYGAFAFGWILILYATFLINHFDLLGLRQVWLHLMGRPQTKLLFVTPSLRRAVRHLLYVGWLFVFWFTPVMTVTHLVFALATSAYILVAIQLEERDLMKLHPEYAQYRARFPMLLPRLRRRAEVRRAQ